jgi:hypothetical protein
MQALNAIVWPAIAALAAAELAKQKAAGVEVRGSAGTPTLCETTVLYVG